MKKVALLHYWLTNMRGGENVFAEFCRLFPEGDIFTHAWNPEKMGAPFNTHKITETFIGSLPGARNNCQKFLPLMPLALQRLDLSGYELILSSESGPVKGVRKAPGARHVCYCHSPMRYLWDMYDDYYKAAGPLEKVAMRLFRDPLRKYDLKSAEGVDHFIANSRFIADRIKRIYRRDSEVIHPPVDTDFYTPGAGDVRKDYYLFAGQLISYKRPDLAMRACMKMKRKLVLVGDGSMRAALETEADPSLITFAGRADRDNLRRYYAEARALIFPGIEDFGIVPLEAQGVGTPVIALGAGGALETVLDHRTGVFFPAPEVNSLCEAIEEFEKQKFDSEEAIRHARTFHTSVFLDKIRKAVQ